jgi:hypothetical protein
MLENENLEGLRFGNLIVLPYQVMSEGKDKWCCKCDCGEKCLHTAKDLLKGKATSCSCTVGRKTKMRVTVNKKRHPLYGRYFLMLDRCYNPKNNHYHRYGKRGIYVHIRWRNSFDAFIADMGLPLDLKMKLDRINNDGPYSPKNCRWATDKQQAINREQAHHIMWEEDIWGYSELCTHLGVCRSSVFKYCKKRNMEYQEFFSHSLPWMREELRRKCAKDKQTPLETQD